jgi:hypothetical protein
VASSCARLQSWIWVDFVSSCESPSVPAVLSVLARFSPVSVSPFVCASVRFVPPVCCSLFRRRNFVGCFLLLSFSCFVRSVSCSVLRGGIRAIGFGSCLPAQVQESSSSFSNFDLFFKFLCVNCCREEVGVILESPDRKTRGLLV